MLNHNPIFMADSYKLSHAPQYPEGTTHIFDYASSRGGVFDKTVVFAIQYFIKEYLSRPITHEHVDEAVEFYRLHGVPFDEDRWRYIVDECGGKFPVKIRAVPEGSVVDTGNVLLTMVNTDPNCFWASGYLETSLLRGLWYGTTVATTSWHAKKIIRRYLEETADNLDGLDFKLHDFGARGVSSAESAAIGGAAHLVNFLGTDTVEGIRFAMQYYNTDVCGFSIPAGEHSTMTSWGRGHEEEAYANMLETYPEGLVAFPADSYNIFHAVDHIIGEKLRNKILQRNGTVVVRPDSGDPVKIVYEVIRRLGQKFGKEKNSKGYWVLPPQIRVIQGDGINIESLEAILENLKRHGWSADNIAFGMGGGLLQHCDRDTQKFALKCSAAQINGRWVEVFKDPFTDPNKASLKGRLDLIKVDGEWTTVVLEDGVEEHPDSELVTVYENGDVPMDYDFATIKHRANSALLDK